MENNEKKTEAEEREEITCEPFGNRCNICGTFFEDTVCDGHHEIGKTYLFPKK